MINGRKRGEHRKSERLWHAIVDKNGICFNRAGHGGAACLSPEVNGFVEQLIDDGYAYLEGREVCLPWSGYFSAISSREYGTLPYEIGLPEPTRHSPSLESIGSLTDTQFSIDITNWVGPTGKVAYPKAEGAVLHFGDRQELMSATQWALLNAVADFTVRPDAERDPHNNKLRWGRVRQLAVAADAGLDDFLYRSVVLTPETLQLHLRKSQPSAGSVVVEITPDFDGAPSKWLNEFDRWPQARAEYTMTTEEGIVQVLVRPEAQTVLREIKRMSGRRMAGERAQAFLHNPYAVLGNDAHVVINEEQFLAAREEVGLSFESFSPVLERDDLGALQRAGLLISNDKQSEREWLTVDRLEQFIGVLRTALRRNDPLLAWDGHDLEVDGNAALSLSTLEQALDELKAPQQLVAWEDVYDLSRYSDRVTGVGEQEAYYSVYIVKENKGEWIPDNLALVIGYVPKEGGERVLVRVGDENIEDLRAQAEQAKSDSQSEVACTWLPKPMPLEEAERILTDLEAPLPSHEPSGDNGMSESGDTVSTADGPVKPARQTLLIYSNINQLDYDVRRKALENVPTSPTIPHSLRSGCELFEHQQCGLAWLQHLYEQRSELDVQGAILADDMGLGKTLQLLAFITGLFEEEPDAPPALVVAPVALLQNWHHELEQFFVDDTLPVLIAYGKHLNELKVPPEAIDKRLREESGLVNFLRPGWANDKKLILTTYETLRSLEFSFAMQPWSIMVCDEAQKIKNPEAMVTRAAKKQHARFKIACTGTPVENTLADLWCLFDFVQPGLLGALDEFGKRYRKPIEAKTEEEKQRVEELRERIEPQILRRTKVEVATNLPLKLVDENCRRLPMSNYQRSLYVRAISQFNNRDDPEAFSPFKNHLTLLHYLRGICTDPRHHGEVVSLRRTLADYREIAPKMDWVIQQLKKIQGQDEKVIIFCEFRDIQRLLRHYIGDTFDVRVDIVNGSTTSDPSADGNRQARIDAFQRRPGFGVIILSPAAVGFGLNIQAANHVIHYTRVWNPAKEDQATDRAYRIGQTKDVHVYYPVVAADDFTTFDVQLDRLLKYKRGLAEDILNGTGEIGGAEFGDVSQTVATGKTEVEPRISVEDLDSFTGRYFEGLVAALWSRQGHPTVILTPQSGDHGVDVVVVSSGKGVLIQAKVTSQVSGLGLGWEGVRDVVGGEEFYKQQYPNVKFTKCCVTNHVFNKDAHEQAKISKVSLIERKALRRLLKKHPITCRDVDYCLYS